MKRWIVRIGLGLLALVALALVCGASYEAMARRRLAGDSSVRGAMVDIGGRSLHIDCRGAGSPTIVFESGLGSSGARDWELVHDEVARMTRACSYSRAGILTSDPGVGERDANAVAEDLHALLERAGERPPLVLVAHSLGGAYALTYTQRFGTEVAGLVLVDTLHPDSIRRMEAAGIHIPLHLQELQLASMLSWTGLVRWMLGPAEDAAGVNAIGYEIASLDGMCREMEALDRSLGQAGAARQLGNRPLYVLSAGKIEDEVLADAQLSVEQGKEFVAMKQRLNEDKASWSSHSRHEVVADAMHRIQWQKPDRVINATRWVVDAVRASTSR